MEDILELCKDFVKLYPELEDPNSVVDACGFYSNFFIHKYSQNNKIRILNLFGHRSVFENRHPSLEEFDNPDPYLYHCVCVTDTDFVIDVTYRQLDSKGPVCNVVELSTIKEEWLVLSYNDDITDLYVSIGDHLLQASFEWRKKSYPKYSDEDIKRDMAESMRRAKANYEELLKYIKEGTIIFTGTEEDNIHLRKLNVDYKSLFK